MPKAVTVSAQMCANDLARTSESGLTFGSSACLCVSAEKDLITVFCLLYSIWVPSHVFVQFHFFACLNHSLVLFSSSSMFGAKSIVEVAPIVLNLLVLRGIFSCVTLWLAGSLWIEFNEGLSGFLCGFRWQLRAGLSGFRYLVCVGVLLGFRPCMVIRFLFI